MPCQPCLCDGIWTAWNYLWQKYELFSTFFHYFPKFSTIFSTAQPCFFRSIKAFAATWVAVNRPPQSPRPPSHVLHHFVPPFIDHLSSITSSTTYRPSLHRSFVVRHFVHHFVDHLSSPTSSLPCPPSHRRSFVVHHFVDHLSSITSSLPCPPSHRRSFVVHHFIDHLPSITSSTTSPPSFVTFHHSPPGLTAFSPCIVVSPGGFQLD